MLGCVDASAPPVPITPTEEVVSRLFVTPDALVMAVGDSLRPAVSARNLLDEPLSMADGAAVVWTSSDNGIVSVDANGWIHAHQATPGTSASLTASWMYKNVTVTRTININITDGRINITSLHLVPEDSTRTSTSEIYEDAYMTFADVIGVTEDGDSIGLSIQPTTTDSVGGPIPQPLAFQFYWGGPIGQYLLRSHYIGPYWIHVKATVYGVPLQDSVRYTGLYAHMTAIQISQDANTGVISSPAINQTAMVQPCASVRFSNPAGTPFGIEFDDPGKTGVCKPGDVTGNIASIGLFEEVARVFPAEGTVKWTMRNLVTGQLMPAITGTVIVRNP